MAAVASPLQPDSPPANTGDASQPREEIHEEHKDDEMRLPKPIPFYLPFMEQCSRSCTAGPGFGRNVLEILIYMANPMSPLPAPGFPRSGKSFLGLEGVPKSASVVSGNPSAE